jgi:glutathione S-transferase
VPVLIHGNKTIAESDLISWYLAESFPTGTSLIPEDPFERLRVRRFIQEVPGKLISAFYSTMHFSTKSQQEQKAVI